MPPRLFPSLFLSLSPLASAADVTFTIDVTQVTAPISRYVYGINPTAPTGIANPGLNQSAYADLNLTSERLGGNRWTAYNWTNNASNAGNDYRYQSDNYLSPSATPGDAMAPFLTDAAARNVMALITVPINGYLAADKSGPQPPKADPATSPHFVPAFPTLAADPNPAANHVYQDKFVAWVQQNYVAGLTAHGNHPIAFSLDNEPDLWSSTHPEVHPAAVTYAELTQRSAAYARAIKSVAPDALVFGPASYGWNGFQSLQNAHDAKKLNAAIDPETGKPYGDFLSYYLAQMHASSRAANVRLLDALDVHWYPEATGPNAAGVATRISGGDASPGVAAARMHAPRSLWDPTYVEQSWITKNSTRCKAIQLIPRLQAEIAANYPGTKLTLSEYNFGAGADISGGVAQADALGLFGKLGVFSADEWPQLPEEPFILGALRMFRNYDGHNATFGDTAVAAVSTGNTADTSIYASTDSTAPGKVTLVAVNESANALTADIVLTHLPATCASFKAYQLTAASKLTPDGASALPTYVGTFPVAALATYTMPAASVSTIVLAPTP